MACTASLVEKPCRDCVSDYLDKYPILGYIHDYFERKNLVKAPTIRSINDWFKYSWMMVSYSEPVIGWLAETLEKELSRGVKPEDIYLKAKWRFWVKMLKGGRWRIIAYRDPVVKAGLPYWNGFQQVNTQTAYWVCPGNPPGTSTITDNFCTGPCLDNNNFAILFSGSAPTSFSWQAGVGNVCCYSAAGYNMSSPSASFNNTVDSTGTKNVSTWTITGTTSVSISGPYLVFLIDSYISSSGSGVLGRNCYQYCSCTFSGAAGTCGCSSGYIPNVALPLIYENLGSLSISSSTTITASVQLIIALASPG